jgi:hypothetical protein
VVDFTDGNGIVQTTFTDNGNINTTGLITTGGSCHNGCLVGQKRVRSVDEYASTETEPTIEDSGEGNLVDGRADVELDPRFANVIDQHSNYIVTVTPEDDCRGLYVTDRTLQGFSVRELQGGRSNIAFAYRIEAKRFGVSAPRLPIVGLTRVALPQPRHHT